ncbi:uncharacterized protein LOC110450060 [Mizuhopecten yessoensis]|uniref:Ariadne-like RING finger protein n=1 Tax=Mizuhopecten yessoensis TaxID=6573 RepID=A0A210QPW6_MIZYE|nr:uncharacterized protein LOC110450060 [Mizuhopecten yessoensis]XP_021352975.1 uncharacterized protein LOC110450060 [Mizuhopecten yessoensis]OWF50761.1 Ariadne-like RING finger protein [Mizuhopecten yessoensis]
MAATPMLPPGGLMEIVFSFDTTGSMSSVLEEIQGRLQDMIQRLQADIPGIRIGVIAHGDYCDEKVFYLTKELDLCSNVVELCNFVKDVEGTGGGDEDECYELILRMVRQNFSWTPASQKIPVMIGDANPHEPEYEMNVDNIDWRTEVNDLHNMGVKIYGVQVFENEGAEDFYKTISTNTEGHFLKLGEFSNICDFLMAICYRERGDDLFSGYEAEVRGRFGPGGIHKDLEGLFGTLRKTDSNTSGIHPVPRLISPMSSTATTTIVTMPKPKKVTLAKQKVNPKRRNVTVRDIKNKLKCNADEKLVPREKAAQTVFTCNCLDWSSWKLAYIPVDVNEPKTKDGFKRIFRGECHKRVQLFTKRCRSALYEVAVQTKAHGKRHVMFSKVISGLIDNSEWEYNLLFGAKLRLHRQIKSVVEQGCKVFVRRAVLSKKSLAKVDTLNKYSYAWALQKDTRQHRRVVRDSVVISGECMEE